MNAREHHRSHPQNEADHSPTGSIGLPTPALIVDSVVLPAAVWTEGSEEEGGTWKSERMVLTVTTNPATREIISADLTMAQASQEPHPGAEVLYLRRPAPATAHSAPRAPERRTAVEALFTALNRKVLAHKPWKIRRSVRTNTPSTLASLNGLVAETVRDLNCRRLRRR